MRGGVLGDFEAGNEVRVCQLHIFCVSGCSVVGCDNGVVEVSGDNTCVYVVS